jgi:iron complex transport system substrate-binding protein
MLITIGAGDRIVGMTDATMKEEYLSRALPRIRSIGVSGTPDIETIVELRPDVLIAFSSSSKPKNMDRILAQNITVIYVDCYKMQDLAKDARVLGVMTGKEEDAEQYAQFADHYVSLVKSRVQNLSDAQRPRIYCEANSDYYAWAGNSTGDDIIQLLNGKNIAENLSLSGKMSPEWLLDQDPDVIIKLSGRGQNVTDSWKSVVSRAGSQKIRAVREHRVYALYHDTATSPRAVAGLLYLAKQLYPDRFADVDPDAVLHEYAREFLPGSDKIDTFYPPLPDPAIQPAEKTADVL